MRKQFCAFLAANVFTQPRSLADLAPRPPDVRFAPESGNDCVVSFQQTLSLRARFSLFLKNDSLFRRKNSLFR